MAAADAAQYAETLRQELIQSLGLEDLGDGGSSDGGEAGGYDDLVDGGGGRLAAARLRGLDKDLEALSGNEVIAGVLEAGRVPREYASEVEARLRSAELESIQDYIAEADTLVALHGQARGRAAARCAAMGAGWRRGHATGRPARSAPGARGRRAARGPRRRHPDVPLPRRLAPPPVPPARDRRCRSATRFWSTWSPCWGGSSQTWARCPTRSAPCRCRARR
jgi:hypothetical protein